MLVVGDGFLALESGVEDCDYVVYAADTAAMAELLMGGEAPGCFPERGVG